MIGSTQSLRVLVTDDESATRMMSRALFERRGHHVWEAADGAAALATIAAQPPFDVILLDLHMPGRDGGEVLAEIRADADPARAGVVVVMLTNNRDPAVEEGLLNDGADAVLAKPLRWETLAPALATCLTDAGGAAAAHSASLGGLGERKTHGSSKYSVDVEAKRHEPPEGLIRVLDAFDGDSKRTSPLTSPIDRLMSDLPRDKARRLIEIAHVNLTRYQADLQAAALCGDAAEVARLAHKVAGVASTYGCDALGAAAATLERDAERLGDADLRVRVDELNAPFAKGVAFLRAL